MTKIIRTTIDEEGNILSDLSGFTGDACVAEEERFRRELAQYGLYLEVISCNHKKTESPQQPTISIPIRTNQ